MKMSFLRDLTAVFCIAFLAIVAASGDDQTKAVGDEVSFRPTSTITSGDNIIWKHTNNGNVIVAIELDDGIIISKSPLFKDCTDLNKQTGEITIKQLALTHSGRYTIDINSKQQKQEFTLTVKERVPKPEITIETSLNNPDVVYLTCKYNKAVIRDITIIWMDSTGKVAPPNPDQPDFIKVEKSVNAENYYTCTLDNIASNATSEKVKEGELFKGQSSNLLWLLVIPVLIFVGSGLLYQFNSKVHGCVQNSLPCKKDDVERQNADGSKNATTTPLNKETQDHPEDNAAL